MGWSEAFLGLSKDIGVAGKLPPRRAMPAGNRARTGMLSALYTTPTGQMDL